MPDFSRRVLTPELMDAPDAEPAALDESLRFIRGVNRWLRGSSAVIGHLQRWSSRWPARTIRILDLGTGSADIPLAIARWARNHRPRPLDVHITAVDLHPVTLDLARRHLADQPAAASITLMQADAFKLPFDRASFDYVTASMFLHHFPDIRVMTLLKVMDDMATRGLIWNDLLRHRRAYAWIRLITAMSSPMVKHDARVSVLAGFRKHEIESMRDRLDLPHLRYHRHFGHRFTLAGEGDV